MSPTRTQAGNRTQGPTIPLRQKVTHRRGTSTRAAKVTASPHSHIISRTGVLIGHPGELGTVNLTAADVETLGVSDLKKELAARGETTTGGEFQLKTRLTDYLHTVLYPGS